MHVALKQSASTRLRFRTRLTALRQKDYSFFREILARWWACKYCIVSQVLDQQPLLIQRFIGFLKISYHVFFGNCYNENLISFFFFILIAITHINFYLWGAWENHNFATLILKIMKYTFESYHNKKKKN